YDNLAQRLVSLSRRLGRGVGHMRTPDCIGSFFQPVSETVVRRIQPDTLSIGSGTGPPIGFQSGPLLRVIPVVHRMDPRVTRRTLTSDRAARVGGSCEPTGISLGVGMWEGFRLSRGF